MNPLTLELARTMIQVARQHADANQFKATIAIVDAGGHVIALERMDGALLASLETAQVKARTSVYFGAPTRMLPMDKPFTPALIGGVGYAVAFVPGGLPIRMDGQIVGGIGVGGGTSEQDESAAQAGMSMIVPSA